MYKKIFEEAGYLHRTSESFWQGVIDEVEFYLEHDKARYKFQHEGFAKFDSKQGSRKSLMAMLVGLQHLSLSVNHAPMKHDTKIGNLVFGREWLNIGDTIFIQIEKEIRENKGVALVVANCATELAKTIAYHAISALGSTVQNLNNSLKSDLEGYL